MRRSAKWLSASAAAMGFTVFAMPFTALACSVGPDYTWPTLEERTLAADYVIVGSVEGADGGSTSSRSAEDYGFLEMLLIGIRGRVTDVTVDKWLKGTGSSTITVSGFGAGGDCRSPVPKGTAIMFLVGDAQSGDLALNHIGVYDAVTEYRPEAAEEITQAIAE